MKEGWQTNNFDRMLSHMKAVNRKSIDVGIVESKKHPSKGRVYETAQIYQWMEEGTSDGRVPKRPTLKPTMKKFKVLTIPLVKNLMYSSVKSGNYMGALNDAGRAYSKLVKHAIMSLSHPALSPYTIANRVNKGTSNPLVDTKLLHNSIGHKVV